MILQTNLISAKTSKIYKKKHLKKLWLGCRILQTWLFFF